jgi:hypothetical protein
MSDKFTLFGYSSQVYLDYSLTEGFEWRLTMPDQAINIGQNHPLNKLN